MAKSKTAVSTPHTPLWKEPLYWLLIFVPVGIALELLHASGLWIFVCSAIAIVPLAGLMGRATENLAVTFGAAAGALMNATFGNLAEFIIAIMVMRRGPEMYPLVKASITGSIIGNLLLVLGLAIALGGLKRERQTFNRLSAGLGCTLLAIATIGLMLPTLYFYISQLSAAESAVRIETLSEEFAVILAVLYILSLVFSFVTHKNLISGEEEEGHPAEWSRKASLLVLVGATTGVAVMSEFLVGSVEAAAASMGMSQVFIGVVVVAIVGNAAEHSTAILVAMKNKMDLAFNVAVGSSLQVALFVAPALVLVSLCMGYEHPLDFHFTLMEVMAVLTSVAVLTLVASDGESHWMEGVMLLALYVMLALAFYHLPLPSVPAAH